MKYLAEFIGTFLLVSVVIGSGIMAENISNGNIGIALLGNTIATGAILYVIIKMFGSISGAHFNPAVSFMFFLRKELSSFGSSTSATAYGGYDTAVRGYTEDYDGTSWTEVADLSTARYKLGGAGSTGGSGLAVGGTASPGVQSAVEEWTQSHNVKTITD